MKKILISILTIILLLSLVACKSPTDMIGEAIGKNIIKGITGADVEIIDDGLTIKGENGEEMAIEGTTWPDNEVMKSIPKFTKGAIEASFITDAGGSLSITDVTQADYESYIEEVKKAGFTVDSQTIEDTDVLMYTAANSEKVQVSITFAIEDPVIAIFVSKIS